MPLSVDCLALNKSLHKLSDQELIKEVSEMAKRERELTLQILHYLREVERRRLYAAQGFPSLFEFCTSALGYSAGATQRRLASMRLLKTFPELEEKVRAGDLKLSQLAQADSFFKQEEKQNNPLPREKKEEVLKNLAGQSTRQTERKLLSLSSEPQNLRPEKINPLSDQLTELRFIADKNLMALLDEVKALAFHKNPNPNLAELLKLMAEHTIKSLKKKRFGIDQVKEKKQKALPALEVRPATSSSIPVAARRQVYQRDGGCCTFVSRQTKRKCGSRVGIQFDHIVPVALGGLSSVSNLRLVCASHNKWLAKDILGVNYQKRNTKGGAGCVGSS